MLRAPTLIRIFAVAFTACGFGHAVDQDGKYVTAPGTAVTDSAPYPLESLLIVEEDVDFGQTRIYVFTGSLRQAALGLEDLRRIAARHGGFQMAFDAPREPIERDDITGRGPPLAARAGDRDLELSRLDDTGLRASGASRYLSSVSSSDYFVAAYAAVLDEAPERIAIERRGIDVALELPDPALRAEALDDELGLSFGADGDYVLIELSQLIRGRGEDGRSVDALVRTGLPPGAEYRLGRPLLTDVAGQGCWSSERTLTARLTQVARRYERRNAGDWAVIHSRIDAIEIGADTWSDLQLEPNPSAYCREFE